jgi:hypothetical protein
VPGLPLQVGHELGQRLPGRVGTHHQHRGVGSEACDGLELVASVKAGLRSRMRSASGRIEIDDRLISTV